MVAINVSLDFISISNKQQSTIHLMFNEKASAAHGFFVMFFSVVKKGHRTKIRQPRHDCQTQTHLFL